MQHVSNSDNVPTSYISVEPRGNACLICPVNRNSMSGVTWTHGNTIVFRDGARMSYDQHLQLNLDICNTSYHTLEVGNMFTLRLYETFYCATKDGPKAIFITGIQGKLYCYSI